MQDIKQKKKLKFNMAKLKEGVLPLLGVALIVFFLTVAIYFVADYVAGSYQKENTLSGWDYQYTEKAGAIPEGELRVFNAQNPLLTEGSVRKKNLYLTKTIEAEDTGKKAKKAALCAPPLPVASRIIAAAVCWLRSWRC